MTPSELNAYAATEIMGYVDLFKDAKPTSIAEISRMGPTQFKAPDPKTVKPMDWNPAERIEQAFMVLGKFENQWELFPTLVGSYGMKIMESDRASGALCYADTPALAILRACVEAHKKGKANA